MASKSAGVPEDADLAVRVSVGVPGRRLLSDGALSRGGHLSVAVVDRFGGVEVMHQPIYEKMKRVAKDKRVIPYGEIAKLAKLDMHNIGDRTNLAQILGEISTYEHEQGRPMLSAVVVLQDTLRPGQGFFTLARELGLHTGIDRGADEEFFIHELQRVHRAWATL